ncbi:hypothetical protein WJR50_11295 [Catalinimonas sp. 4WD22]|uniref:hypothetical protein n=1 Tax=Catalinimonas locisalis TaxID=3133978 RepID=UPI00310113C4
MRLNEEQVIHIQKKIEEAGITMESLKEDLLDHICCVIEHEIKKGKSFDAAYDKAIVQLSPNGLNEIQGETVFLLNFNKIIRMKKIMYAIGLLASMSVSIGYLFIILRWPGGPNMFNYGILAFVLIFLPLLAIDRYKVNISQALSEKIRLILGFSSAFLTGLSVVFKLLHLQGATILIILGAMLFAFGFLPFLFFRMYKRSIE